MNNQELERNIKEIISTSNFFDAAEIAVEFNKKYKKTTFYKKTRMSLNEVIKNAKLWYLTNLDDLFDILQEKITNLDLSNIDNVLDQIGDVFGQENRSITEMIQEVKDISLFNK